MMSLEDTPTSLPVQGHLFGEPPQRAEASQLFTPPYVARRMAAWIPETAKVLEPSAGSGNLIAALLERGHDPSLITAVEKDPAWAAFMRERFGGAVTVICGDFFEQAFVPDQFHAVISNWPYEQNLHTRFAIRCLELARMVVTLVPISFEYTQERDRELWAPKGIVVRRAKLPERVDHGGEGDGGKFDSCALSIRRRTEPRRPDEVVQVSEEVWRRSDVL